MNEHNKAVKYKDRMVLTELLKSVSNCPNDAAKDLLTTFPSFSHILRADKNTLKNIVGNKSANLLSTIPRVVTALTREVVLNAPCYIKSLEAAKLHFAAILNGRRNEAFAVLYLNYNNRLLEEDIWEGGIDRANVYPREILRRALLLDASAILIAHNHPSGDTTPSEEDFRITDKLQSLLDLFDIVLLDHYIFGEGKPFSFRTSFNI